MKNQTVKVSWQPLAGAQRYQYALDSNAETVPGSANSTKQTSLLLNSVKDGIRHFHVAACNSDGCGPASHYLVRVDTTPPLPVAGLVGASSSGKITISWHVQDDISGIKGYQLMRSSYQRTNNNRDFLPTDPGVKRFDINSGATSFVDSEGLTTGIAYYYRVLAIDNAGNVGAPSGVRTVRNFAFAAENIPANANPLTPPPIGGGMEIAQQAPAQKNEPKENMPLPETDKEYGAQKPIEKVFQPQSDEGIWQAGIVVAVLLVLGGAYYFMGRGGAKPSKAPSGPSRHAKR